MDNLLYTLGYWRPVEIFNFFMFIALYIFLNVITYLFQKHINKQFSATLHQKPILCYSISEQSVRGILTLLRRTHHGDE